MSTLKYEAQKEQQLHRMSLKRCKRCGVKLYADQVQNIYKFNPPFLHCAACREKDAARKRVVR